MVLDSAAGLHGKKLTALIQRVDRILIPIQPSPFDMWASEAFFENLLAEKALRKNKVFMNCYEFISFNFGPTLLTWMERQAPDVYARVLEGDRKSMQRLGHGNAIAQIYHHVIMPLATDLEKRAEIAWALADFEARFGRRAEGMWLSEAAVDTRTLDLLAQAGVRFTILAPRQAREVAPLDSDDWSPASEASLDIREPYLVELPEGRSISVYFYNGPLSQAVAFEGLLRHGDMFWGRLASLAAQGAGQGLLALATDGETYGHHFKFGEMALAFALSQARAGVGEVALTNYATYLEQHPPKRRARIHENSSCRGNRETTGIPCRWANLFIPQGIS